MPFSWRKLVLPSVLLKLVGRSPQTNVVSGGSTDFDQSEARGGLSWDGEVPLCRQQHSRMVCEDVLRLGPSQQPFYWALLGAIIAKMC